MPQKYLSKKLEILENIFKPIITNWFLLLEWLSLTAIIAYVYKFIQISLVWWLLNISLIFIWTYVALLLSRIYFNALNFAWKHKIGRFKVAVIFLALGSLSAIIVTPIKVTFIIYRISNYNLID